jgi:hypothetical protein
MATYTVTGSTIVDSKADGIASVKKDDTVVVTAQAGGSEPAAFSIVDITAIKASRASLGLPVPSGSSGKAAVMVPVQRSAASGAAASVVTAGS